MTYKIQIDDTIREATKEEAAEIEARENELQAAFESAIATKQSARAKLKALGLTDDEIAALVG